MKAKRAADPATIARVAIYRLRGVGFQNGQFIAGHTTQADLAKILGISVATIRNWEQGRSRPTGPALVLLRLLSEDDGGEIAAKLKHAAGRDERMRAAFRAEERKPLPKNSRWAVKQR